MNWYGILWEATKSFGPAIIAWGLAVWNSKINSKKEWEKALKQMEIAKSNNAEVQNRAYKLQFCLTELEKKDQLFEEAISKLNIVLQSTERFRNPQKNEENVAVISAAQDALDQLHLVMFNTGTLTSLVKASGADEEQYQLLLFALKSNGEQVEATLHYLFTQLQHRISEEEFDKNYQPVMLSLFISNMIQMQNFIMKTIESIFKEM